MTTADTPLLALVLDELREDTIKATREQLAMFCPPGVVISTVADFLMAVANRRAVCGPGALPASPFAEILMWKVVSTQAFGGLHLELRINAAPVVQPPAPAPAPSPTEPGTT